MDPRGTGPEDESGPDYEDSVSGSDKPTVRLSGTDGNVFAIIGAVSGALKRADLKERAAEFTERARTSPSYDAVLQLVFEYVEVM